MSEYINKMSNNINPRSAGKKAAGAAVNVYGSEIFVSHPSANETLYNEIMPGSNQNVVKKNIEEISRYQYTDKCRHIKKEL